ncbi:MAG: recombination regulator RecX [Oscillospiraceae bacterium]|nr:recombination regulator RecX [Oscillospiraceae bacterium]
MRILELTPSRRVAGQWVAVLEDGKNLQVGENEVLAFSLYAGRELPDWQAKELMDQAGRSRRRERAIDLLSRKPLSRKELTDRLLRWGADDEEAHTLCQRMEQLGYLNDEAYARRLVRYYTGKGYGERRLREEFCRRGVPRQLWEQALEEMPDPAPAIDALIAKHMGQGRNDDAKEIRRLSDTLARRGFSWSDISAALSRYRQREDWPPEDMEEGAEE